jgi:hypothetical protein
MGATLKESARPEASEVASTISDLVFTDVSFRRAFVS